MTNGYWHRSGVNISIGSMSGSYGEKKRKKKYLSYEIFNFKNVRCFKRLLSKVYHRMNFSYGMLYFKKKFHLLASQTFP